MIKRFFGRKLASMATKAQPLTPILNSETPTTRILSKPANLNQKFTQQTNEKINEKDSLIAEKPHTTRVLRGLDNSSRTIVQVRGIPSTWDERHIQKYFDPLLNKIDRVEVGKTTIGQPSHKTLLFFKRSEDAEKFVERYHNDFINSSKDIEGIKVEIFAPRRVDTRLRVLNHLRQVQLYSLPFEATNLDVLAVAEKFGTVEDLQLPLRSARRNKGYALVTFSNKNEAKRFCEGIDGLSLFGRKLKSQQKFISFVTQKPRMCSKSDEIYERAETQEVQIKGALYAIVCEEFKDKIESDL